MNLSPNRIFNSIPSKSTTPLLVLLVLLGNHPAYHVAAQKCFEDRDELKYAIDSCFEGGEDCVSSYGTSILNDANDEDCDWVKETYGWPMNTWCVGAVTDMHFLFVEKREFNEDISLWDVSRVTDMYETFSYASSFNGDLSKWDTSKVVKTYGMFNGCESLKILALAIGICPCEYNPLYEYDTLSYISSPVFPKHD